MKLLDYMPIWQRDISLSGLQNIQNYKNLSWVLCDMSKNKINIFYDQKNKFLVFEKKII